MLVPLGQWCVLFTCYPSSLSMATTGNAHTCFILFKKYWMLTDVYPLLQCSGSMLKLWVTLVSNCLIMTANLKEWSYKSLKISSMWWVLMKTPKPGGVAAQSFSPDRKDEFQLAGSRAISLGWLEALFIPVPIIFFVTNLVGIKRLYKETCVSLILSLAYENNGSRKLESPLHTSQAIPWNLMLGGEKD